MSRSALLAELCWRTGVVSLLLKLNRRKLVVITVHSVMSEEFANTDWHPNRTVISPKALERQIKTLRQHFTFVSADTAVAFLRGEVEHLRNPILLTIDDGYKNAISLALPILLAADVPSIVFLPCGEIDRGGMFWFDRVDYILQQIPVNVLMADLPGKPLELHLGSREEQRRSCIKLIRLSRGCFRDDLQRQRWFQDFVDELEARFGVSSKTMEGSLWTSLMTFTDARQALSRGLQFGSHTVDHVRLAGLAEPELKSQLVNSKAHLEEQLRGDVRFFCFPEGSYDDAAIEAVKDAEYDAAFCSDNGLNLRGTDLYTLKRFHLKDGHTEAELLAMLTGLFNMLQHLRELTAKWFPWRRRVAPTQDVSSP